jgi:hypothetical protein
MKTGNKLIKSLHAIDLIICICLMPITFSVLMHSPEVSENLCFFHIQGNPKPIKEVIHIIERKIIDCFDDFEFNEPIDK